MSKTKKTEEIKPLTFAETGQPSQPEPEDIEQVSAEELAQLDEDLNRTTNPANNTTTAGAVPFRTIQEIEEDLKKPVPEKYVKTLTAGPAKGKSYIPWAVVQRMLSYYAPGWSTSSQAIDTPIGVGVITHLTIPTATGPVTRAGHGFEPHKTAGGNNTGFGGAIVVASAQAFKRSAVSYGLGRDLYPA
jgi:hypothetical protein